VKTGPKWPISASFDGPQAASTIAISFPIGRPSARRRVLFRKKSEKFFRKAAKDLERKNRVFFEHVHLKNCKPEASCK
jgi:hypothetical protein